MCVPIICALEQYMYVIQKCHFVEAYLSSKKQETCHPIQEGLYTGVTSTRYQHKQTSKEDLTTSIFRTYFRVFAAFDVQRELTFMGDYNTTQVTNKRH